MIIFAYVNDNDILAKVRAFVFYPFFKAICWWWSETFDLFK